MKKKEKKTIKKEKYLSMDKAIKMTNAIDDNFKTLDKDLTAVEEDIMVGFKGHELHLKAIAKQNKRLDCLVKDVQKGRKNLNDLRKAYNGLVEDCNEFVPLNYAKSHAALWVASVTALIFALTLSIGI